MDNQLRNNLCYHYTSTEAFLRIMDDVDDKSLKFHASDVFYLNDPSEMRFGYEVIMNFIPKIEKELDVDERIKLSKLWDRDKTYTNKEWNNIHLKMIEDSIYSPYIISFSRNRESLPMWRMYGNNGTGVALGFDLRLYAIERKNVNGTSLLDLTHFDYKKIYSVDVEYGKILKFGYPYINAKHFYFEYLKSVKEETDIEMIAQMQLRTISKIILGAAPYLKHDAYSDEKESRLVNSCHSSNDIKFKTNSAGRLIPYIEVEIPKAYLKEIMIGPCCNYDSMKRCIDIRLSQKGFKEYEITHSKIPYIQ